MEEVEGQLVVLRNHPFLKREVPQPLYRSGTYGLHFTYSTTKKDWQKPYNEHTY
jgi:hypothetical protein